MRYNIHIFRFIVEIKENVLRVEMAVNSNYVANITLNDHFEKDFLLAIFFVNSSENHKKYNCLLRDYKPMI